MSEFPVGESVTPGMIDALKATKPWVRLLAILGFICVGLMALVAVGALAFSLFQSSLRGPAGLGIGFFAVLYLVMAVLYFFPSRYLYRYASAIEEALAAPRKSAAVERALREQKSFWKFAGIMTLVIILLYIPGLLAAVALPNLLNAMQRSKQKRTMADLRSIATALEARATDTNEYPNVQNLNALAPLLEPKYIKVVPRVDGWGNPFVYEGAECQTTCTRYYLASGGKDGKMDKQPSEYGTELEETTKFEDEIVLTNGAFIRVPEGVAK